MQTILPSFEGPAKVFIVFHRDCKTWWVNRLIPDEFKHVSAVAFYPHSGVWVFFDPALSRTKILVHPNDAKSTLALSEWVKKALVVEANENSGYQRNWWRPTLSCVGMVAHFAGVKSRAVLPSGFLRDCLKIGGRIISDEGQDPPSPRA